MKVFVKGEGEVSLDTKDFIAKGGEGSIYARDKIAYKIFEDPKKMIPYGKIQELSVLDHPDIVKPERLILDAHQVPIGYTMKYVKDNLALCQLFTKAFRVRNKVTPAQTIRIVRKLHDMVASIHSKNILIVDLNELNFLISSNLDRLYAIDVNCYQTKSFPATAIMESVRDRHCKHNQFNQGTDWFSFAVLATQLLVGIHPYKGGHPQFENTPLDERMDARMKANISIFNPKATVPAVCQSFDVIPPAMKNWLIAVLEDGQRESPPRDYSAVIARVATAVRQISGTDVFELKQLASYMHDILAVYFSTGVRVVVTTDDIVINNRQYHLPNPNIKVGFTKMNTPIGVWIENGMLKAHDILRQKELQLSCAATHVTESGGRLYAVAGNSVFELQLMEQGETIMTSLRHVGNVLDVPGATQVFDGVVLQNLLGKWYASIFPKSGQCVQIKLNCLDSYQVVEAAYENHVLVIVGIDQKTGRYDRLVIKLDATFSNMDVRKVLNIVHTGLNFTVGDQGTAVFINEEEKVEATSMKFNAPIHVFDDKSIDGDMLLFHEGAVTTVAKGNKLYSFTYKRK